MTSIYKLLFLVIPTFSWQFTSGQNPEPVIVSAKYQFVHVSDTNNKSHPDTSNMLLYVGKTNSKYSYEIFESPIAKPQPVSANSNTGSSGNAVFQGMPLAVVKHHLISEGELFQIPGKKKLVRFAQIGIKDYYITSELPHMNWIITEEERTILGYACHKAVGEYAGRSYYAWFAIDLPFSNGPWKLNGLPGLILEATDTRNEVKFLCKAVEKGTGQNITLLSDLPITVTTQMFERAERNFNLNPAGVVASQAGMTGTSSGIRIYYQDSSGNFISGEAAKIAIASKLSRQINNPIELPKIER